MNYLSTYFSNQYTEELFNKPRGESFVSAVYPSVDNNKID